MDKLALNQLPKFSPWPARLLGLAEWVQPTRDLDKIESEYNDDKYADLKTYVSNNPGTSFRALRTYQLDARTDQTTAVSKNHELYQTSRMNAHERADSVFLDKMHDVIDSGATVVELGCGWGYNLGLLKEHYPQCTFIGGEYATNAVDIAADLFADHDNIVVREFNYYDESWRLFDGLEDLVVFTRHSIEQLPSAEPAINGLLRNSDVIKDVVHCEPVVGLTDESFIGLLRQRYAEANDYNQDLLSVLSDNNHVSVVNEEADVFGLNPFNPSSIIRWRPHA